jgi:hypothetical protein
MANAAATATAKWIAEIQAERAKSLKSSAPSPSPAPAAPSAEEKPVEAKREEDKEAAPPDVDLQRLEEDLEFDAELSTRLLGLLYYRRKENPDVGAMSILKCEQALGVDRGGLAFVLYLLKSRRLAESDDKSRLRITIDGIEALRRMMQERSPKAQ